MSRRGTLMRTDRSASRPSFTRFYISASLTAPEANVLRPMPAARTLTLLLLLALAAPPAQAETSTLDPETIKSSLEQFLSIATFGIVTIQDQGAEVTRSGASYKVRLPLAGFSAPPDAAVNA